MQTVAERILSEVEKRPEGALIGAKEFAHLGSRAAVDQALKRLKERNELLPLYRGVYVRPVKTRFGMRAPAAEKVIEQIVATRAETVVPHGAANANSLGLTTQVPTKLVFLTSGPTRTLTLGAQTVEMKHAPPWKAASSAARRRCRARPRLDRATGCCCGAHDTQGTAPTIDGRASHRHSARVARLDVEIHPPHLRDAWLNRSWHCRVKTASKP